MPAFDLIPHPDFPASAVRGVRVHAESTADRSLRLSFLVSGPLRDLHLPAAGPSARRDELWRTTCFEVFVRFDQGYAEFNLSPSGSWAAYRFDDYRAGMRPLDTVAPVIDQNGGSDWYELTADVALPPGTAGTVALSAVIEAADGAKSYWALVHAPGPPDFHNPACFVARLPAPAAS